MNAEAKIVPRPAATVLLVRDGPSGLEVLMVTRNVASDFASGALVFPGGRVDAADGGASMLERCRAAPGIDAAALAFRVAGIRESFEEAHVLLARPRGSERLLTAPELDAREAVDTIWIAPQTAVAEADAKRVTLVFATRMNLLKLARSGDVAAALAAACDDTIVTVCPEVVQSPAGTVLRIPLSAGYGVAEVRADITVRAWVPRG